MRMPSSLASAAATSACAASSTVSPSTTKSVALCSVSGISCATWPIFHAAGIENSPLSSCSVPLRRPKKDDLPAPLRPTRPIFSPGVKVTDALSSTTLTPRRSVTLRTEIIKSYFEEDRHDSRPTYRTVSFLAAEVKSRLRVAGLTGHKARRILAHRAFWPHPVRRRATQTDFCRWMNHKGTAALKTTSHP